MARASIMSPDDYRARSGYRRSIPSGGTEVAERPHSEWAYDPNPLSEDYVFADLKDPRLADFLGAGRRTASGPVISEWKALRNSTFFRAVNLIAGAIGMLPVHLMKTLANGDTEEATDHPLFSVLKRKPNSFQTALEFKSAMQTAALLDGNAYALVVRGVHDKVVALIPLKRHTITPLLSETFELTFRYSPASGGERILTARDVFHFRGMVSRDGLRGISLLDAAAESLGLALATDRAAARLYRNGVMIGGSLQTDKTLGTEAIDRIRQSLEERYSGTENAEKWLVLEEGLKVAPLSASARDNQHLEMRKHQDEEIARFLGVPRPLLMFDETSWGSGIEQLGQFFVTYCLAPWIVGWEQAIERCLSDSEQGVYFAKFNEGALLRGSLKDQSEFFAKALGSGGSQAWVTPDEVRGNFDMNKITGGDQLPERMAAKGADPTAPEKDPANG